MTVYADLIRYRELFGNLFRRDVQAKYRGSLLGVAWTLANPVLLMAVYLLVFSVLWKTQFASGGHYGLFLLVGLSAWIFFATAVQSASRSMLDNANLIRKTRFPRQLVPLSIVASHLISFVAMLAGLLVLNFALLPRVRATEWLAIPLAVGVVAIASGLALAVAGRARVPVFHYSPNEVKLAVTADGRADKPQVQLMVARLLGLTQTPRPDAGDALALCLCHLGSAGLRAAVSEHAPVADGLARAVAAAIAAEDDR
jgi:hypothetical protein